jgi:hypothetical protein
MELKMKPVIEPVGKLLIKLLIFVFLFGATFVAFPYLIGRTYTESSSVIPIFPIAILDHGTPDIIRWSEYQKNVQLYKDKIILAPTQKEYKLSGHSQNEFVRLTPAPNNVFNLFIHENDLDYWAEYSVSNGIVKPISYRVRTPSVMFACFPVAFIGTPLIGWAYKRFLRRNREREKLE